MNSKEKDVIYLQFLKSDKIYLAALLYAIILGISGGIIITLGYELFIKDSAIWVKQIIF